MTTRRSSSSTTNLPSRVFNDRLATAIPAGISIALGVALLAHHRWPIDIRHLVPAYLSFATAAALLALPAAVAARRRTAAERRCWQDRCPTCGFQLTPIAKHDDPPSDRRFVWPDRCTDCGVALPADETLALAPTNTPAACAYAGFTLAATLTLLAADLAVAGAPRPATSSPIVITGGVAWLLVSTVAVVVIRRQRRRVLPY